MREPELQKTKAANYISLATYRKSGVQVATPIWAVFHNDRFFAFSASNAGKVKRIRNSNRARIARCDARGKLLGDWFDATATLIHDEATIELALSALRQKYGWQMWLADVGSKITGRYQKRAYLSIEL